MSNVVQFLEALSLDTNRLTDEGYTQAIAAANFDYATQEILLKRDPAALSRLLGGSATVLAYILPAEGEEPERKEDEQPNDGDHEGPEHVEEQSMLAA